MKQIYLILLCLFINNSNICAASKTDKEATSKENHLKEKENPLIEAVKKSSKSEIKKVLSSGQKFSFGLKAQSIKIISANKELTEKQKAELINLILHYSPELEKAIKTHLPAPIASIVEEYTRSNEPHKIDILKNIEEKIKNFVSIDNKIHQFGGLPIVNIDSEFFSKLNNLDENDVIQFINFLKKKFKLDDLIKDYQSKITSENLKKIENWGNLFKKSENELSPIAKSAYDQTYAASGKILSLIYEYLYNLLDKEMIEKNEIENINELKKRFALLSQNIQE